MARKYHMNWEGPPNFRWRKMYKGAVHRITCQELGAMEGEQLFALAFRAWVRR